MTQTVNPQAKGEIVQREIGLAGPIYHILPMDDLKEHEESAGCWCGPRIEFLEDGDIVIHEAADGRE